MTVQKPTDREAAEAWLHWDSLAREFRIGVFGALGSLAVLLMDGVSWLGLGALGISILIAISAGRRAFPEHDKELDQVGGDHV